MVGLAGVEVWMVQAVTVKVGATPRGSIMRPISHRREKRPQHGASRWSAPEPGRSARYRNFHIGQPEHPRRDRPVASRPPRLSPPVIEDHPTRSAPSCGGPRRRVGCAVTTTHAGGPATRPTVPVDSALQLGPSTPSSRLNPDSSSRLRTTPRRSPLTAVERGHLDTRWPHRRCLA